MEPPEPRSTQASPNGLFPIFYIFFTFDLLEECIDGDQRTQATGYIDNTSIMAMGDSAEENVMQLFRIHEKANLWPPSTSIRTSTRPTQEITVLPQFLCCASARYQPKGGTHHGYHRQRCLKWPKQLQKREAVHITGAFRTSGSDELDVELAILP